MFVYKYYSIIRICNFFLSEIFVNSFYHFVRLKVIRLKFFREIVQLSEYIIIIRIGTFLLKLNIFMHFNKKKLYDEGYSNNYSNWFQSNNYYFRLKVVRLQIRKIIQLSEYVPFLYMKYFFIHVTIFKRIINYSIIVRLKAIRLKFFKGYSIIQFFSEMNYFYLFYR